MYPFADLELARRLERAEGLANARCVEARARVAPEVGATWITVAGAMAMFDGPESPITQTFGLGLFDPVTAADLARIEAFFDAHGAPAHHEVSPIAGPAILALLTERRYQPFEFTSVMYRTIDANPLREKVRLKPDATTEEATSDAGSGSSRTATEQAPHVASGSSRTATEQAPHVASGSSRSATEQAPHVASESSRTATEQAPHVASGSSRTATEQAPHVAFGSSRTAPEQAPHVASGSSRSATEQAPHVASGSSRSATEQAPHVASGSSRSATEQAPHVASGSSRTATEQAPDGASGFSRTSPEALTIRTIGEAEGEVWARTAAEGWSETAGAGDFMLAIGRILAVTGGAHLYLAELDGRPIAAATLHMHEGVALMGGASTIPSARGRGAQLALLERRLQDAFANGCDIAMMGALPGSISQRNAERHGFRIAYTRIKWRQT